MEGVSVVQENYMEGANVLEENFEESVVCCSNPNKVHHLDGCRHDVFQFIGENLYSQGMSVQNTVHDNNILGFYLDKGCKY